MIENDNTAIVRRWFKEVWNERRLDTIDELMAPNAVAHDLGGPGASTKGPDGFRAAASQIQRAFGKMNVTIEDIFGVGNRVAVRFIAHLEHTGHLGDLPPTGRSATMPVMCIVHMRDGQIVEGWNFWDVATALRTANAPAERRTLF